MRTATSSWDGIPVITTGEEYVDMLRDIIVANRFRDFDDAWIEGISTARLTQPSS